MAISDARIVGWHIDGGASVVHLLHPDAAGTTASTDTQDTAFASAQALLSTTLGGTIRFPLGATLKFNNVPITVPKLRVDAAHTILDKSTATVGHMFYSLDGNADGFTFLGPCTIEMNATSFSSGQTVSAFHMVRAYDLTWQDVTVSSGIEEAWKLYNVKNVRWTRCTADDFANNGVQIAVQSSSADGFTGSTSLKPPVDIDGVYFDDFRALNMDDGTVGEGQGISIGVASGSKIIKNVFTTNYFSKNCYRAWHSETNLSSQQIQNVVINGIVIEDPIRAGIVFAGIDRGQIDNVVITQTSSAAAASTDGEANLITITGSSNTPSRGITIGPNITLQGGSSANTDYGIIVKQTCGFSYMGGGHISRCATPVGSDSWNTVWDFYGHDKNPICIVGQSSAQVVASSAWTSILWGYDLRDPHGMNSSSTAASHKVTPPWPGQYEVVVGEVWPGTTSGGDRGLRIYRDDGVTAVLYGETIVTAATSDTSLQCIASIPIQQGSSQFVKVERFQGSTATLTPSTAVRSFFRLKLEAGTT